MSEVVKVKLWGTEIGRLGYFDKQTEFATFEFNEEFLEFGIEVSPINVSTARTQYTFDDISIRTFHGLPGFIADSLPDKFGNQLIDQYFAKKGIASNEITALDRLLYVGNRSMGALEFEPTEKFDKYDVNVQLNLQELSELAEMVLKNKEEFAKSLVGKNIDSALSLLRIGSSAGGARSKALVAIDNTGNELKLYDGTVNHDMDCSYYLLKFDSEENSDRDNKDPKGMTKIEYIYSLLAKKCDINMPNTDYIITGEDDFHFLIERFDRVKSKKENSFKMNKLHYVSWSGIAHAHRDTTGTYSYEQLVLTARQLNLGQDEINEIFRRTVFNIVGRNQDDHTKNFGFLMNRQGQWSLSPAFDMTYSFDPSGKWTRNHQIKLNDKQNDFTLDDLIEFGKVCNIKKAEVLFVLKRTVDAFLSFKAYADEFKVSEELKDTVIQNLRFV